MSPCVEENDDGNAVEDGKGQVEIGRGRRWSCRSRSRRRWRELLLVMGTTAYDDFVEVEDEATEDGEGRGQGC